MPEPRWIPPFYVSNANRERVDDPSYHNDCRQIPPPQRLLIKRTLSGTGVVYVGSERHLVPRDHVMVVERPGPFIYCHEELAEPWCFEFISVAIVNPGESLLPAPLHRAPVLDLRPHPDLARRITELVDLRLAPDYEPSLRHSAMAYSLYLAYVAARHDDHGARDPQLHEIRRRLGATLTVDLDLAELAAACHCRPETLVRRFRAAYGLPPMRYRLLARLRRACELLDASPLSIKEIAATCGFASADYFARQFRRHLGTAPSAYRASPDPLLAARLMPASG